MSDAKFKREMLGDFTPDQRDIDLILNMERQIAILRASQETLSKDYKDLQARKATMLKDLKGTREQRVKAIEDSKLTFASLVKIFFRQLILNQIHSQSQQADATNANDSLFVRRYVHVLLILLLPGQCI